jgi:hypothetical protein
VNAPVFRIAPSCTPKCQLDAGPDHLRRPFGAAQDAQLDDYQHLMMDWHLRDLYVKREIVQAEIDWVRWIRLYFRQ